MLKVDVRHNKPGSFGAAGKDLPKAIADEGPAPERRGAFGPNTVNCTHHDVVSYCMADLYALPGMLPIALEAR